MNLQHMKYAVEVGRTGSISQAADNLFMNQPNLSKAIKELEASLGVKLFQRTSRGVKPTPQGEEFLVRAGSILAQLDEMTAACRRGSGEEQRLRISVPRGSYIAQALTEFVNALDPGKGLDVDFLETNSLRAIQTILHEGYSLGIIRYHVDHEAYFLGFLDDHELQWELLWEYESRVLLSERHPLASQATVDESSLRDGVEITHGDLRIPYQPASGRPPLDSGARRIYVYERGSQFDLLDNVPGAYMWVSPMPQDVLARNHLVQRPCPGTGRRYKDVLITLKGHRLDKLERLFLEKVAEARQRVEDQDDKL